MLRQLARVFSKAADIKSITTRSIASTSRLQKKEKDGDKTEAPAPERFIQLDKEKNVTMIGINRSQQRNAINSATAAQLCDAFNHFEADDESPVAVLYGVGGSFCAGFDILEMATDGREEVSIDILMRHEGSVGPTRRLIRKPVVCSINGYCVANGLELALMCDLRVMEETAVMGFFNRRFGVPVIDGGTVRLPAMVGLSRALDLILTGRQLCADEAYQMGIANRVVPTGSALTKSLELAHTLAKFPQSALLHDRNSLYSAVFEAPNFGQAIQNEIMYTSKDIIEQMQEGIKWFHKNYSSDTSQSWLKREKSMADWDDDDVAEAAAKVEEEKRAQEAARVEAEKKAKESKETTKKEKPPKKEPKE